MKQLDWNRLLSLLLAGAASMLFLLAAGFAFQFQWVTGLWPWPDSRLSYLFIGSILAAVLVSMFWIAWSAEWGALAGGALNVLVMAVGATLYLFLMFLRSNQPVLLLYSIIALAMAVSSGWAFLWSRRVGLRDARRTPRFVLFSFGLFALVLLVAGTALILQSPIFPWPLNSDSSVIFGCIFLGDAFYFIYGLLSRLWHHARGQLLSFLAYDLVLIFPFINQFQVVKPERLLSLSVYTLVLIYSGALAIYYLFLDARTKRWKIE